MTDGGLSGWLYPFITQCATENKRIDYVAVHYCRSYSDPANPTGAANQLYNFLLGIYNTTKKPIWITEWNNGANWTTYPDPTAAQQAATVNAMLDMPENAHFVESRRSSRSRQLSPLGRFGSRGRRTLAGGPSGPCWPTRSGPSSLPSPGPGTMPRPR